MAAGLSPLIERHRKRIKELAAENEVANVRVFGSMARGEDTPESDIDLLVSKVPGGRALGFCGLMVDVEDLTGRKVNVVFDHTLDPYFKDRVLHEAVVL